ncbi:MAG TPA: DUF1648 domain-containing protein [Chitinivibrionales bacterium]|jgi:uncharacterized membrane protein|nr:DUF1648 domain-containing protein [Chitinivibrionales bacterium]
MIRALFFASSLAGPALQFFYSTRLPERMASHFTASGQPNSWMPRNDFIILNCFIYLAIFAMFSVFPYLMKVLPSSLIHTPNKHYWLSSQNRSRFVALCSSHFYSFGLMTNGLLIYVFHQVYRFNLGVTNAMAAGIVASMLVFVVGMLGSAIHLTRRLNRMD